MIVISVVSLKGGVGKTTVTLGLAGAALRRGVRVLVLDLDPQSNASTVLDPDAAALTAADVLDQARSGAVAAAAVPSGWGADVRVVVSETSLSAREAAGDRDPLRLRRALGRLDAGYADGSPAPALVLLDCPPALGHLTRNALAASDRALVVTEPALFALHGAAQALDAVEAVRQGSNLRLAAAGIVVNRVRPRSAEHRHRLGELREAFPELLLEPPVLDRSALQQAAGAYLPVQALRSPGAREAAAAFDAHLTHLLGTDLGSGPLAGRSSRKAGRR
ncbi:cellulose biosynthesis protein BcsQ [Motilibacter peucedani]|uniref:Cellulose biosynthesis protein BcsQ n=1 Tax=Motilibacter peucedani TaxID=598650 RepID=A0A420XKX3_9ACTN|nr:ParA family protein [Motilibacter peucedani]RKS68558.1 cellulose biosynthesis protein BcsQ [Motilibacter peucedani]